MAASNATLRRSNEKLTTSLEELKIRDEELSSNNKKLVDQNARILGQLDEVKEELHAEKATTASLRTEVESITAEAQAIAVNAVLSARAELMAEFKKGEHSSWDPDEEIRTWERRQTLMAGGEVSEEEEVEEATLAAESPKQKDDVAPEQGEPAAGAEGVVPEPEDVAAPEDPAAGEDESDVEEEEAPAADSPKTQETVTNPGRVEPDAGAEMTAPEAEDVAASAEDIAKD